MSFDFSTCTSRKLTDMMELYQAGQLALTADEADRLICELVSRPPTGKRARSLIKELQKAEAYNEGFH